MDGQCVFLRYKTRGAVRTRTHNGHLNDNTPKDDPRSECELITEGGGGDMRGVVFHNRSTTHNDRQPSLLLSDRFIV